MDVDQRDSVEIIERNRRMIQVARKEVKDIFGDWHIVAEREHPIEGKSKQDVLEEMRTQREQVRADIEKRRDEELAKIDSNISTLETDTPVRGE